MLTNISLRVRPLFLTIFACLLAACAAWITPNPETRLTELKAGEYTLDPAHSSIHFKVNHMGFSMQVGRFNEFEASLIYDPQNVDNTSVHALVYTGSIDFNNAELEKTIRGRKWLNSASFPQAEFSSRSARRIAENQVRVEGELTLVGETRPFSIDIQFNGGADNLLTGKYTLGFAATAVIKRSDFGIDSYLPAVGDEVYLDINAEFQRNKSSSTTVNSSTRM